MAKEIKKEGSSVKKGLAVCVAVIASIGAIACSYFLYGTKEGAKKRKAIKGWALKAKGEVLEKVESIKDITEEKYVAAVNSVMKKYQNLKEKYGDEADMLSKELTSYWNHMKKHLGPKAPAKKAKFGVAKAVRKVK